MLEIRETIIGDDTEFRIQFPDNSPGLAEMKKVQRMFEDNDDYTDVLFYPYPQHEIKVIVNRDHYADFLGELIKRRLLVSLEWTE